MNMSEILIVFLIGAVLLVGPLVAFILSIVAFRRSGRIHELARRVALLEARLRERTDQASVPVQTVPPAKIVAPPEIAPAATEAAVG